jgi:hypothetical protein
MAPRKKLPVTLREISGEKPVGFAHTGKWNEGERVLRLDLRK